MNDSYYEFTGPVTLQDKDEQRHKYLMDKHERLTFHSLNDLVEFLQSREKVRRWVENDSLLVV